MAFWETAFLDMVAQERDKIGVHKIKENKNYN
jgi:hypothetical protein